MEPGGMLQMYWKSLCTSRHHCTSTLSVVLSREAQSPSVQHRSTCQPLWALWAAICRFSLYVPAHSVLFSSLAPPNPIYSSFWTKIPASGSVPTSSELSLALGNTSKCCSPDMSYYLVVFLQDYCPPRYRAQLVQWLSSVHKALSSLSLQHHMKAWWCPPVIPAFGRWG